MNAGPDVERRISEWLAEEVPTQAPDRILPVTFERTRETHQRRFGAAWRTTFMNGNYWRVAAAALFAVVIFGVGAVFLGGSQRGVGGAPAPTPSPVPPSPSAESPKSEPTPIDTTGWVPFSSDRYSYDIAIPPTWTADAATRDWSLGDDRGVGIEGADNFFGGLNGFRNGVSVLSAPVPAGKSYHEWIAAYAAPDNGLTCTPIAEWEAITVDGQQGLLYPGACSASQAFVSVGERVYVFSIMEMDQVPLLKAFLSTVRFHPAAAPSASP